MRVRSVVTGSHRGVPRRRLALLARRVVVGENANLDVQIIFAGDLLLRDLNRRYRRKNRTTDVLSFNIPGVTGLRAESGEIYISLPQARRQARSVRQPLACELERLVVHGTLHLLGFDHHRKAEAERMRQREHRYLGRPLA